MPGIHYTTLFSMFPNHILKHLWHYFSVLRFYRSSLMQLGNMTKHYNLKKIIKTSSKQKNEDELDVVFHHPPDVWEWNWSWDSSGCCQCCILDCVLRQCTWVLLTLPATMLTIFMVTSGWPQMFEHLLHLSGTLLGICLPRLPEYRAWRTICFSPAHTHTISHTHINPALLHSKW